MRPVRQDLALPLEGHGDPLEQSVEPDAERRPLQPVELAVEVDRLLRHLPRLSQHLLHVEVEAVHLDPDDGRRAVAGLVAALDRERRQPLGRVQIGQGTELPQVAEPGHGARAGVEEGEHDARLLFVVAVREDDAVPVVGRLDERAEVVRFEAAVQENAEVRRVSAEENSN